MQDPRRYDLSGVKIIDSFSNMEVRLRIALLIPLALQLSWWLSAPLFSYIMAAYLVVLSLYFRLIAQAPRKVGTGHLAGLLVLSLITHAMFISCAVLLWSFDGRIAQSLGMMLWFAAMLNAISPRAVESYFLIMDICVIFLSGVAMLMIEFMRGTDGTTLTVFSISFLALFLYHIQSISGIARFRGKLLQLRRGEKEADRQRAIGQLVGGVAHDFNNLLTVVIGNLQLHGEVTEVAERKELLREAERAARRGADLTGQLLAFSRKSQLLPEPASIDQIVKDVKPLIMRLLGEKHNLEFHISKDTPLIDVDLAKLQAVLMNLILNARDAMDDGGTIKFHAEPSYALKTRTLSIKIADKGTGIEPGILPQVFDPYFTTKPVGKGSGLGLSMAKGFVEQSGGQLHLTSKVGRGTQVVLNFPAFFPTS